MLSWRKQLIRTKAGTKWILVGRYRKIVKSGKLQCKSRPASIKTLSVESQSSILEVV